MSANKEGAFGAPPPDAPQQTTTAGSERPTAEQIAAARANERDLPAFAPKPMTREQIRALIGKDPEAVVVAPADLRSAARAATSSIKPPDHPLPSRLRRIIRPSVTQEAVEAVEAQETPKIVLTDDPLHGIPEAIGTSEEFPLTTQPGEYMGIPREPVAEPTPEPPALPPPLPHQKAASDTDSPSRGIPTTIADPNKKITGGFGVPGEGPADYFPLDGTELRVVVQQLLTQISERLEDDLRFSIACTYPRVSARVDVTIEAYGMDKPMVIPRVAAPHTKTLLEVAKAHADEICFVLREQVVEMTESGESITPTNKMRQELNLEIPRKHAIDTPSGGRQWIDRSS